MDLQELQRQYSAVLEEYKDKRITNFFKHEIYTRLTDLFRSFGLWELKFSVDVENDTLVITPTRNIDKLAFMSFSSLNF